MHLGIDLGTTRTVVALARGGNHPVVQFTDTDGDWHDHFPSVTAVLPDGTLRHGFAALDAARDGAFLLRSVKRHLGAREATMDTTVDTPVGPLRVVDVLAGFLAALRTALATSSSVADLDQLGPVVAGVPANAHTAQRLVTLEAFRRAGFEVRALVNEPSAAGFEFTWNQRRAVTSRRSRVLVYDLGGGTFDASLVDVNDTAHVVQATAGISRLGGDDIDQALAGCVLAAAGRHRDDLTDEQWHQLLDDCRDAKESVRPQTRRLAVELDGQLVSVPVATFHAAVEPLVEQTMQVMAPLVEGLDRADGDIAGIYLVGGSSSLPLVARVLRERFGRRVHRSALPGASTAIGLAIAADEDSGYTLLDRLARGLGVFREMDDGRAVSFDAIVTPQRGLQPSGSVLETRRYRAAHDIGSFRFVEYSRLDGDGQPVGDITVRGELRVAFSPALRGADLEGLEVHRIGEGPLVEECYTADANGVIHVTVSDLETDFCAEVTLA